MTDRPNPIRASLLLGGVLMACAAAAQAQEGGFDLASQIGPDPVLPEPQRSLWPGMKVADVIGWQDGQTPTVAEGLTITAYATDLMNPRSARTLPNGDVLVVQSRAPEGEPVSRPKDWIRDWIMSIAHGGGGGEQKESNLVTLLRDTGRDGTVDERHDLLTDLNSPFGVAWIDDTPYVAATDAILAYPYRLGDTTITVEPTVLTPLPATPSTIIGPRTSRSAPTGASSTRGWAPTPTSWRTGSRPRRAGPRSGRWTARRGPRASSLRDSATRTGSCSTRTPASSGAWSTSATSSDPTSCRTT